MMECQNRADAKLLSAHVRHKETCEDFQGTRRLQDRSMVKSNSAGMAEDGVSDVYFSMWLYCDLMQCAQSEATKVPSHVVVSFTSPTTPQIPARAIRNRAICLSQTQDVGKWRKIFVPTTKTDREFWNISPSLGDPLGKVYEPGPFVRPSLIGQPPFCITSDA
jgi:hypothetical protein